MSATPPPPLPSTQTGDSTGGVIPYKNPHALTAYYCGLFSIIPFLGFILACIALPCGISGLKARKKNPVIRGAIHAWIGIIGGSISLLVHLFIAVGIVLAITSQHSR